MALTLPTPPFGVDNREIWDEWFRKITRELSSSSLDETIQDTVGAMAIDTSTVDFTYNDTTGQLTADVIPSGIQHNDLSGEQGGSASERYHLTAAQHTDLTGGGDSTIHYHATDRDRANHTGTQPSSTISDFTEAAQDAVGTILMDSSTVNFTYDDNAGTITAAVIASGIDHGSLSGLGDDDHSHYWNSARGAARISVRL